MPFIDAHAHLDRIENLPQAIAEAKSAGALAIVSAGYDLLSSLASLEAARENPNFVFACVGLAPTTVMGMKEEEFEENFAQMKKLAPSSVAIGEIGLDYHWPTEKSQVIAQQKFFGAQLDFAMEQNLPVAIHSRKAEEDVFRALVEKGAKKVLLHFFSGSPGLAGKAAGEGFSFTVPPIKSKSRAKMLAEIPLELLLTESDAPFVGKTPADSLKAAEIVAEAKGISIGEALKATAGNAKTFFGLNLQQ
jgi:TatD DNase family protein